MTNSFLLLSDGAVTFFFLLFFFFLFIQMTVDPSTNLPKDSDLYRVKREEALRKYEM